MNFIDHAVSGVTEFHSVFGHSINQPISAELLTLRSNLIEEEANELFAAIESKNHAEIVDALADIAYVVSGTIVAVSVRSTWSQYVEMTKVTAVQSALFNITNNLKDDLVLVSTVARELAAYLVSDDQKTVEDICCRCLFSLMTIAQICGNAHIDITAAFDEAHRSNMTKLWSEDVDVRTDGVASDPERYKDIAFKYRTDGGEGLVGYRTTDGKILKSPEYSDADFTPFVSPSLLEI